MTADLARLSTVEEIWASRLVMADAMNAERMAVYLSRREFGRQGDKANAVASRVPRLKKVPAKIEPNVTSIRKAKP